MHLTKDNEVVIAHDFDLERVAKLDPSIHGSKKYIGEFDFSELPQFRAVFQSGLTGDCTYRHHEEINTTSYCRLEDLFILCQEPQYQKVLVNIDMKNAPRELKENQPGFSEEEAMLLFRRKISIVKTLIEKYNMIDRVFWVSVFPRECAVLYEEENSHINRCFAARTIFKMMAMHFLGFLWMYPIRDHHYTVPFISDKAYE